MIYVLFCIVILVLIAILVFFRVLQFFSDRTYKPTKENIRSIIQATIDGKIDVHGIDDFSSIRIAYNHSLDEIRNKYNKILENSEYIDRYNSNKNTTAFNEAGKAQLRKLLQELDLIQSTLTEKK